MLLYLCALISLSFILNLLPLLPRVGCSAHLVGNGLPWKMNLRTQMSGLNPRSFCFSRPKVEPRICMLYKFLWAASEAVLGPYFEDQWARESKCLDRKCNFLFFSFRLLHKLASLSDDARGPSGHTLETGWLKHSKWTLHWYIPGSRNSFLPPYQTRGSSLSSYVCHHTYPSYTRATCEEDWLSLAMSLDGPDEWLQNALMYFRLFPEKPQ